MSRVCYLEEVVSVCGQSYEALDRKGPQDPTAKAVWVRKVVGCGGLCGAGWRLGF